MSIFKTLDPTLKSKREFETNKTFLSTNNDSASGVFTVQSHSGSLYNYASSSDNVTSIVSASSTKNYFLKGPITINNNATFTVAGTGELKII